MKGSNLNKTENWGSRLGFILGASGFSIGLGNIWRFSYVAGENGGGAFLLIYILIVILIGIPLFLIESGLGRKAQSSAIPGLRKLTKKGSPWVAIGWLGVITAILITSYYLMIMGWIVAYLYKIVIGAFNGVTSDEVATIYENLISSPWEVIGFTLIPTVIIALILSKGVRQGIERFVKVVMPLLFVMIIFLTFYSISLPGSMEGLIWYLKPDFSEVNAGIFLEALGQAFFSIGIGFAAAFTYGSYLKPKDSNLVEDGVWVVSLDTAIAFLTGLIIFPALFAFSMEPNSGAGLLFLSFPMLMEQMPFGNIFGFSFFFLVILAAITTGVGLIEGIVANTRELFNLKRKTSVWLITLIVFLLSIPSILSQGPWSSFTLFGRDIFEFVDYVSGNILLAFGGLLMSLYVVFKWTFENFQHDINIGSNRLKMPTMAKPIIVVAMPIVIFIILISGLL